MTYWIGAFGAALFVVVFVVEGWVRRGYSFVLHPVSALALGPRGWIQTASFVVCGAAITVGALGLFVGQQNLFLGITLIVFGLSLVASGVFPMDPMRGYPPGTPQGDPADFTLQHTFHDHAGAVVFLSLPVAAAIAAFVMTGVTWKVVSAAFAIGLFLASGAFGRAWENNAPNTGLVQRAFIIPGWLWLAALFLHLASR